MINVFIDGKAGTTGLKIYNRLEKRKDINLMLLDDDKRKDVNLRKQYINKSDITFLCLPDDAAKESVSLIENDKTKIIDASTAHRTESGWAYGFPELGQNFRDNIKTGKRTAVPGCHASGFLALVYPLVAAGYLHKDYPVSCHSLTGCSGGGNAMINKFNTDDILYKAPRQYALNQQHKHLKEMHFVSGLAVPPLFSPVVSNYYAGMEVTVPLYAHLLKGVTSPKKLHEFFCDYYAGQKLLSVLPYCGDDAQKTMFLPANEYADKDFMKLFVGGNSDRILLVAMFDNLGKGASGAAVQCMNIMSGSEETTGLVKE
jgi:N-acetyl-gamma-glutamyl-phosphate reductase